eukprot:TRINITY_DN1762_c0_g1_i2.p1 TRINITY_DN1762_c0_g1~~TRINITY_DN1762_c0_g1_i2.p1  ORF type:complete len:220 (+),score=20.82 TRINITY_DN1762_c0_g1_i2:330-989(+)
MFVMEEFPSLDVCSLEVASVSIIGVSFPFPTHTPFRQIYKYGGTTYSIEFWDTPGSERHLAMTTRLCAGAAGIVFVYDVMNRSSFDRVKEWAAQCESNKIGTADPVRILVANKSEVGADRVVSVAEGTKLAEVLGVQYFETSALNNNNVKEAFSSLLSAVTAQIPDPPEPMLLLERGIRIGELIETSPAIRQALSPMAPDANASASPVAQQGTTVVNWM